ncbi:MAG: hypothetical protein U9Q18_04095 [Caldisericota bacterium]|nr:hypothetical protein [Caldisericota bacterium]
MKKLAEEADRLVFEMQMIADNLAEYNSGFSKKKVPLEALQYDVASLARELAGMHGELGRKIKE